MCVQTPQLNVISAAAMWFRFVPLSHSPLSMHYAYSPCPHIRTHTIPAKARQQNRTHHHDAEDGATTAFQAYFRSSSSPRYIYWILHFFIRYRHRHTARQVLLTYLRRCACTRLRISSHSICLFSSLSRARDCELVCACAYAITKQQRCRHFLSYFRSVVYKYELLLHNT